MNKFWVFGICCIIVICYYVTTQNNVRTEVLYKENEVFTYDEWEGKKENIKIKEIKIEKNDIFLTYEGSMLPYDYKYKLVKGNKMKQTSVEKDGNNNTVQLKCKDDCSEYDSIVVYNDLKGIREGQIFKISI